MFNSRIVRHGLVPVLMVFFVSAATAQEMPQIASVCAGCHGEKGLTISHPNAPIIAGIPAQHFEEALFSYQDGARQCTIEPAMCGVVSRIPEEQVIALADYFSSIDRVDSSETYDPALAEKGEVIHSDRCARCHVRPEDEDANESLGIPLDGQRSAYLRYALQSYLNGTRTTLAPQMAKSLEDLDDEDLESLVHYYASYRSPQ